jgi:hypothetical protein
LARSESKRNAGRPAAILDRDAREHLLSAATELFAVQGIEATTFAMIAKRASLTPAMRHYTTTSKVVNNCLMPSWKNAFRDSSPMFGTRCQKRFLDVFERSVLLFCADLDAFLPILAANGCRIHLVRRYTLMSLRSGGELCTV